MPTLETIYEVADRVATITLNRPDKLNAWTATMEQEVRASASRKPSGTTTYGMIVLTGAGRGFCAGADMSLLNSVATQGLPGGDVPRRIQSRGKRAGQRSLQRRTCGPTFRRKYFVFSRNRETRDLAAINGPAVGLGLVIRSLL